MTTALTINAQRALENSDLSALAAQFSAYPMLELEEEFALAEKMQQNNDKKAAQQLILSHMRYVIKISRNYLSFGLPSKDLVQEGTVGLMKAVKNFDYNKGFRLASYAVHWIKAEIHEYILKNWSLVKVATTKAQRKLFFNLKKHQKQIGWLNNSDKQTIAEKLNVKPAEVALMEQRLASHDESFHAPDSEVETYQAPELILASPNSNPEDLIVNQQWQENYTNTVKEIISTLSAREQHIIKKRFFADDKTSLKVLGEELSMSLERVRQLEKQALDKIRTELSA